MSEGTFPTNWKLTTLNDVAVWGSGGTPTSTRSDYYNGDVPWLVIGDLNDGLITTSEKTITKTGLLNSSAKIVQPNNILIAMYGSIGKLGINVVPVATNQAIAFTQEIYPCTSNKYLFYFLFSIRQNLHSLGKGATQKNISQTVLRMVEIPLPPFAEQHRIVAKIEELFSELDKGIEALKTAQEQLKVYRQAVLKYAFEGRLTNPDVKEGELPEGWISRKLGQYVKLRNGYAFKSEKYLDYGTPVVRISNIGDGLVDLTTCVRVKESLDYESFKISNGDILVAMSGATTGKFGRYLGEGVVYQNQRVGNFSILDDNSLNSDYLFYLISTMKNQILRDAYGGAQPNISSKKIEDMQVVIAPFNSQKEVVQTIENRLSVCDKIEENIKESLHQAEALRQSILKSAFEGRLVPQDPNDEPASVLLERIKAERAASKPMKKTRKLKEKA